ncbi:RNA-binding S4 domain-containing protein [Rhodanobacter sp. DHB23]|uniref:RNA-binding S4 domain-containing protein n=1 Tax=Rhodanobacter sp. DHB23 TaxID=2775923 RepID=UPI00178447B5|nr:RNA-binding S4 domain-containing protein [Rhodanobacter sp. DHB23]MBD8872047.1 RNA-binding S4 domain-containing protein [Rhodanobacter sp. DHB23]
MKAPHDDPPTEVRADVWLWAARFFKTRSLAKQAIDGGRIDVNDAGCKPAKALRVGDVLKIGRGEERLEVEVLALADKRGPASVAQALYHESEASRLAREAWREQRRLVGVQAPPRRPDKHARRELRRLKDDPGGS